jgi:hypothetical protein
MKGKYKFRFKGGPGSGHHDHSGLPGVWGGSRPSGAKKVRVTKPKKKKGIVELKPTHAIRLLKEAKVIEPALTNEMKRLAKENDGEMANLEFKLKSEESLAEKIGRDMIEMGFTEEQAASNITDAVRYTMVFESKDYVASVKAVQTSMLKQGWLKYDHKWKKYFDTGSAYIGYNCTFWNPKTGVRFELQFHTPETNNIRNVNHGLYNEFRVLAEDDMKRALLFSKMNDNVNAYIPPTGWETLEGVMR